jgi:3-keto-disaccharide hydrolase
MTTKYISFAVLTVLLWSAPLFAQGANTLTAQEKAQGWQLLFDGKTVKGWHSAPPPQPAAGRAGAGRAGAGRAAGAAPAQPTPGQTGTPKPCTGAKGDAAVAASAGSSHWEAVDGALTGCGSPTGYLNSDQSFKNFVLSLEFKCSEDTNSGVYVRSPKENGGYEVQIWKAQPAGFNTGGIVNTAKTSKEYKFKADQWNTYQITADGDHLVVVLNGETTTDVHDARFAEGNIRLQYQEYPVAFRNVKIKPLP